MKKTQTFDEISCIEIDWSRRINECKLIIPQRVYRVLSIERRANFVSMIS